MAKSKSPARTLEGMKRSWKEAKNVGDRLEEARWANSIGNLSKERGEYVEAWKWYRMDYDISLRLANDGKSTTNLMITCQCLGETLLLLKNYEEALEFMTKHYDLATEAADQVQQQRASTQLGRLFLERASLNEDEDSSLPFGISALPAAKEHTERALEIAQKLKNSPPKAYSCSFVSELVDALNNVALLREEEDDTYEALRHYKQALEICQQEEMADTAELSRVHHNLGRLYLVHRDWQKALRHTKADIQICGKICHKQGEAKGYLNLGIIHQKQLKFDESMRCYRKALRLAKELEDEDDLRKLIQDNMGTVEELQKVMPEYESKRQEQKKLQREVEGAEDAVKKRLKQKQEFAKLKELLDLAGESTLQAWDDHLQLALRFKEVCHQLGDAEKEGDAVGDLAESYQNLREFRKAKECYETSYQIFKRLGHIEGQAVAKLNCGNALDKIGLYEEAVDAYEKAFEIAGSKEGDNFLTLQEQALENLHSSFLIRLKRLEDAREVESRIQQLKQRKDSLKDSEEWPVIYSHSRSRRRLARHSSFLVKPRGQGSEQQQMLHDVPDSESDQSEADLSLNMNISGGGVLSMKQDMPNQQQPSLLHKECPEANSRGRSRRRLLKQSDSLVNKATLQASEQLESLPEVADNESNHSEANSVQNFVSKRNRPESDGEQAEPVQDWSPSVHPVESEMDFQIRPRRRLCRRPDRSLKRIGQEEQCGNVADRNMTGAKRNRSEDDETTSREHPESAQCDNHQLLTNSEECPEPQLQSYSRRKLNEASNSLVEPNGGESEQQQMLHDITLRESDKSAAHLVPNKSPKGSSPEIIKLVISEQAEPEQRRIQNATMAIVDKYIAQCCAMTCTPYSTVVNKLSSLLESNEELNLSECDLDDAAARPLLAALEKHEPICSLDMSHNRLGNETVHNIQKLIATTTDKDPGLSLDLHNNRLGAGCLTQLCQCPVTIARLEVLDLSGNRLTDAVGRHLGALLQQCSALATLQLRSCGLTTRTIRRITAALQPTCSLSKLSIGGNNPIAGFAIAELLEKLATFSSFSELDMRQVDLDQKGVQSITSFLSTSKSISILLLQETGIQNDGADLLSEFIKSNPGSTLMKLDLSLCRIYGTPGKSLCEQVVAIKGLLSLDLSRNHLNMPAAEAIARGLVRAGCRLKQLKLRNCRFGMQGVLHIIRSLKENLTLRDVDLAGNNVTDERELFSRIATTGCNNGVAAESHCDEPVSAEVSLRKQNMNQRKGRQAGSHPRHSSEQPVLSSPGQQALDISGGVKQNFPPSGEELAGRNAPKDQHMAESTKDHVPQIIPECTMVAGSRGNLANVEPNTCDIADSEEDQDSEVETPLIGSQKRRLAIRRRKSKESVAGGSVPSSALNLELVGAVREARALEVLDLSNNGLSQPEVEELFGAWFPSRQANLPRKDFDPVGGRVVFAVRGRTCSGQSCCG